MPIWSSLASGILRSARCHQNTIPNLVVQKRVMSRTMPITPTRWQWHKFKDFVHFYIMIGLIPVGAIVFYTNVFIGPATLTEIPEDYIPKHWEYYRHPITRWLARYVFTNPQQEYEKFLHRLYEEDEKMKINLLEKQVHSKMQERKDYQAFYFVPASGKYTRLLKKYNEDMADEGGFSRSMP